MSLKVENDAHALMAVGHMASALEAKVNEADGPVELPTMPIWRQMWEQSLDITRAAAGMVLDIEPGVAVIGDTVVKIVKSVTTPSDDSPTEESVTQALQEQEARDTDSKRKYVAQDAESDNLVKLIKCQHPDGCSEMVPSSKGRIPPETGLLLCYAHEPKLEGDDFDVIDEG